MKRTFTYFLLIIVSISSAFGQDSVKTEKAWNLRECIEYALSNNLDVRRGALDVESSQIDRQLSKFDLFPNLNGNGSYGSLFGRSIDPTTNLFVSQQINSFNLGGSSQVLLWNGFRLQNTLKQYNRLYEASGKDLERTKNDVALNVASLYLDVLLNKEQRNNAEKQLQSTGVQVERTRKLVQAGSLAKSEVLNLEAQYASNELSLTQYQNAVDLSLLRLQQYLQLPASSEFDVVTPDIKMDNEMRIEDSAEDIYQDALQQMPEVKAANLRLQGSAMAVKAARGSLYPRLNMNANVYSNYSSAAKANPLTGDYPFNNQLRDNLSESVNVGIAIPIFNGFSAQLNVQRAIIANNRAEIDVRDVDMQLRQSIESAHNDAVAAAKTYQSAMRQVAARDEAFRMTEQRYELGSVNSVEYQISENDLFQAQSDLVRAKYDFIFKKKVLEFYQGKSLDL